MDIAAIVTKKELFIRSVHWAAGLPQPLNMDVCYTPFGFIFPSNNFQPIIDALNTKQVDAMTSSLSRWAILTHDNELRFGRINSEFWTLNTVSKDQRFYCFADEAESHYLAVMIHLMSSNVIEEEMQLKDTAPQLLRRLRKHWPLVGDYLKFNRKEIVAELNKRYPHPEEILFHSKFTRVIKD